MHVLTRGKSWQTNLGVFLQFMLSGLSLYSHSVRLSPTGQGMDVEIRQMKCQDSRRVAELTACPS
jgi:hypothetical protein